MRLALLVFLLSLAPEAWAQTCPSPLAERDWSTVDAHAVAAGPRAERSMRDLALYLRRVGTSDAARIRAVFRWVAEHVEYDVSALTGFRPSQSADTTFATRKAVCEGYSRLTVALLEEIGVEARYVTGWVYSGPDGVGVEDGGYHAWVAAKSEAGWVLLDPTWASGTANAEGFQRQFRPLWFAMPPDAFARTHIPEREAFQLLRTPISRDDAAKHRAPEAVCRLRLREERPLAKQRRARPAPRDERLTRQRDVAREDPVVRQEPAPRREPVVRQRPAPRERPWQEHAGVRYRWLSDVPGGRFASGTQQSISIEVEGAHAVAVFSGSTLAKSLRASGGVWSGTLRVGTEPVRIGVKLREHEWWRMVALVRVE